MTDLFQDSNDAQPKHGIKKLYTDGTYFSNNRTWHVEDSPWKARQIEGIMEQNRLNPMTVCEVGCGAGVWAGRVVGVGLERAGDRVLPVARREADGRVDGVPRER